MVARFWPRITTVLGLVIVPCRQLILASESVADMPCDHHRSSWTIPLDYLHCLTWQCNCTVLFFVFRHCTPFRSLWDLEFTAAKLRRRSQESQVSWLHWWNNFCKPITWRHEKTPGSQLSLAPLSALSRSFTDVGGVSSPQAEAASHKSLIFTSNIHKHYRCASSFLPFIFQIRTCFADVVPRCMNW